MELNDSQKRNRFCETWFMEIKQIKLIKFSLNYLDKTENRQEHDSPVTKFLWTIAIDSTICREKISCRKRCRRSLILTISFLPFCHVRQHPSGLISHRLMKFREAHGKLALLNLQQPVDKTNACLNASRYSVIHCVCHNTARFRRSLRPLD